MAYTPISTTPTSKADFNYILDGEAANQNVANRPVNELVNYVFDTHVGSTGASHGIATQSVNGFMSSTDKTALDNLYTFKTIAVSGQSDVVADTKTDTLTLVAGTNVSITTNATSDSITISANDTSVDWSEITSKPINATTTVDGFMSSTDKIKIDRFTTYTLTTTATSQTVLKIGNNTISGTLKIVIQATSGTSRQSCEVLLTHNGTTTYSTEYGNINTGSILGAFDFNIVSNDINILITSASTTSTVYKILATSVDI